MKWQRIESFNDLEIIKETSREKPVLIFKHSTKCGISSFVLKNFEKSFKDVESFNGQMFYLDLLNYRDISNQIAESFDVVHESPQIIIINDGLASFHASHQSIDPNLSKEKLSA